MPQRLKDLIVDDDSRYEVNRLQALLGYALLKHSRVVKGHVGEASQSNEAYKLPKNRNIVIDGVRTSVNQIAEEMAFYNKTDKKGPLTKMVAGDINRKDTKNGVDFRVNDTSYSMRVQFDFSRYETMTFRYARSNGHQTEVAKLLNGTNEAERCCHIYTSTRVDKDGTLHVTTDRVFVADASVVKDRLREIVDSRETPKGAGFNFTTRDKTSAQSFIAVDVNTIQLVARYDRPGLNAPAQKTTDKSFMSKLQENAKKLYHSQRDNQLKSDMSLV